ncbi:hypothetical protein [Legionella sp. W05-934-2]|jgi:hypothetical protein|uniref:hypothetical protein n=1 Tax=Legionella sp. W05-934-2 TaxID=1198649 RepID=UPI003461942D
MRIRSLATAVASLALFVGSVHANWVCNVSNDKEQQFTYSAPQETDAEQMALSICQENGIKKDNCDADCFDTGTNTSRWHCAITNSKRESWSFTMLNKDKALALAKLACNSHGIKDKDCHPTCAVE